MYFFILPPPLFTGKFILTQDLPNRYRLSQKYLPQGSLSHTAGILQAFIYFRKQ
jgi:hypothetical protein